MPTVKPTSSAGCWDQGVDQRLRSWALNICPMIQPHHPAAPSSRTIQPFDHAARLPADYQR